MIFQILQNNSFSYPERLILLAFMLAVVFGSLTLHEVAHGYASYALGDFTAKERGRLSLNPIKHLHPVGMLCMIFCGFGWAKAVPVDPSQYKNPKKGMAITALAGPLTNLVIGVAFTVNLSVLAWLYATGLYKMMPVIKYMSFDVYALISNVLYIILYYNLLLAVFNLFPVPPLDGSRLLLAFLPEDKYFKIMRYETLIMLLMFFLLWTGFFTGFFETFVDLIITGVGNAVYSALNLLASIVF